MSGVTLVDTNILLDLFTDAPAWADWSIRKLDAAAMAGPLVINEMVYIQMVVSGEIALAILL